MLSETSLKNLSKSKFEKNCFEDVNSLNVTNILRGVFALEISLQTTHFLMYFLCCDECNFMLYFLC